MESRPVVGLIARPKSSSRLRDPSPAQPPPPVHSTPLWIVALTVRGAANVDPLLVLRTTCTVQGALPLRLGFPITLASLASPARCVPYHATSTRPALPPATVGYTAAVPAGLSRLDFDPGGAPPLGTVREEAFFLLPG